MDLNTADIVALVIISIVVATILVLWGKQLIVWSMGILAGLLMMAWVGSGMGLVLAAGFIEGLVFFSSTLMTGLIMFVLAQLGLALSFNLMALSFYLAEKWEVKSFF
jgi:uncharacterized SAM-binding protein YcdF (DUF218 family)